MCHTSEREHFFVVQNKKPGGDDCVCFQQLYPLVSHLQQEIGSVGSVGSSGINESFLRYVFPIKKLTLILVLWPCSLRQVM
jgi:hypothetical protein